MKNIVLELPRISIKVIEWAQGAMHLADKAIFEVAYEGPAVDDGIMNVRELAPALLAIGDLVENSNRVIGDPKIQVKVVVKTGFEKGSFQIALEVICGITEQLKALFDMSNASSIPEALVAALWMGTNGALSLLNLLKLLRGRKINNLIVLENGHTRLEIRGNNGEFEYIEATEDVMRLYKDVPVRQNLRQVLEPLQKEGIEGFSVRKGTQVIDAVAKDQVPYYEVPIVPEEEKVNTFSRRMYVKLVEVAFEDNLKWRVSDGENNKYYVSIVDEAFMRELDSGKAFAKGDILEVVFETTQIATSSGIKNEHRILEVIDHISKPQQLPIPFEDDNKQ